MGLIDGVGIADVLVGIVVMWRVRKVKRFHAELQVHTFGNREVTEHAEIPIKDPGELRRLLKPEVPTPRLPQNPRIVRIENLGEGERIIPVAGRTSPRFFWACRWYRSWWGNFPAMLLRIFPQTLNGLPLITG